jgi:hypothetical protein
MAEITFMPGRHSSSKFSHVAGASGLAWRLISNLMVFAMFPQKQLLAFSHQLSADSFFLTQSGSATAVFETKPKAEADPSLRLPHFVEPQAASQDDTLLWCDCCV